VYNNNNNDKYGNSSVDSRRRRRKKEKMANYVKGEGVPDFVLLDDISEDAVMENIKIRYGKDIIYVRTCLFCLFHLRDTELTTNHRLILGM